MTKFYAREEWRQQARAILPARKGSVILQGYEGIRPQRPPDISALDPFAHIRADEAYTEVMRRYAPELTRLKTDRSLTADQRTAAIRHTRERATLEARAAASKVMEEARGNVMAYRRYLQSLRPSSQDKRQDARREKLSL